jgi:hypothetical protein
MHEHVIGIGHNGPPREVVCLPWLTGAEAQIFQRERPVTTAGKSRAGEWVLRFERRTPPFVEPLVGWTGGEDTLASQVDRCDLSMLPDLEQALVSPAAVFDTPGDVLRHPLLTHNCKREILWRWAWDEYLIEIAQSEGMSGEWSSRLDEVRTALIQLGDEWHPHPAAPAAFPLRLEQPEPSLAA